MYCLVHLFCNDYRRFSSQLPKIRENWYPDLDWFCFHFSGSFYCRVSLQICSRNTSITPVLRSLSRSIAVTLRDRPFAAPQTGPYDLGFKVVANGGFAAGMSANAILFISSAGEIAFLPVIAEMRDPRDFKKALFTCMSFVGAAYIALSLVGEAQSALVTFLRLHTDTSVVYKWCGQWVTTPSLGSAGGLIKKVSYGIALIGLVISGCIYLHLCAKYVFVRILRKSKHLQANTFIHWATWLSAVWGLAAVAFLFSEGIPVYSWMAAISGAICFAPLSIMLPAYLWVYDHPEYRKGRMGQKAIYWIHWLLFTLGTFMCVGGTYATAKLIQETYASNHNYGKFNLMTNFLF